MALLVYGLRRAILIYAGLSAVHACRNVKDCMQKCEGQPQMSDVPFHVIFTIAHDELISNQFLFISHTNL